ncbi:NUDIX domain-containing protein [Nocardia anaemiae]|uniref:NUDIX domain-containing protein n=1 Tax=Nocardia anaemiae TaxID=263910 RepID=UPI0007A3FBE4|nr:NUDIX domain-containing protein [Nocardia anaemiae]
MSVATEIIARAIIRDDGRLLVARERGKTWAFLPGGHVEPGERVESALIRELAEELGTAGRIIGFAGVIEHRYTNRGNAHHELNLIFEAELDGIPISQEDHLEFDWLPIDQIDTTDLRPSALKAVIVSGTRSFWHSWNDAQ